MRRTLVFLVLGLALSLGSPVLADDAASVAKPLGPGSLFPSVEAAVLDGLSLAHQTSMESRNKRVSRGGTVVRVRDGFTYGPLIQARISRPDKLRLRLGKNAVAHFHTYPKQHSPLDRRNETHSSGDRAVVDHHDSKHRPSYVLTPSLRVVVYRGNEANASKDVFVASLDKPDLLEQRLAGR